jgi:uncharacterized damage-inducible protein DinB
MRESTRIISLFEKLYNGDPWIDLNIIGILNKITAAQASKKIAVNANSIWEITVHLIQWRLNVLDRLGRKTIETPENNYFEPVKDNSDKAWVGILSELAISQNRWIEYLKDVQNEDLEKLYPENNMSYYEHIQGIIQHDAYHLGQIVLLSKLLSVPALSA